MIKELACEMECSRGEDYRLIKLTIIDYNNKKDHTVVVECRGHDAARFHNINHAHGWEKDVVDMVEEKEGKKKILVSFECETLKSEKAAEEHIKQFMPKLSGLDAVGKSLGSVVLQAADPVPPKNQRSGSPSTVHGRTTTYQEVTRLVLGGIRTLNLLCHIVNIGRMSISGMDSEAGTADSKQDLSTA
ncbi:hypothetical protein Golob_014390 [Gossypium lobatum]|uniref:Uncharacterized protein n=1 Tax=Gossypium lobatum TaxID=34289 RepID=A0A7J8LXY7_9ROSI|nr:hypothetical protein [Gossypium lobatum]